MQCFRLACLGIAVTALFLSGCKKAASSGVIYEKTVDVAASEYNEYRVPDAPNAQNLKISANSADASIDLYVVLDKDLPTIKDQLDKQASVTANVLTKKEKARQAELSITVPAGQACHVILVNESRKTAAVKLKIVGEP